MTNNEKEERGRWVLHTEYPKIRYKKKRKYKQSKNSAVGQSLSCIPPLSE